jgi:phage terminase large subunit-like protein
MSHFDVALQYASNVIDGTISSCTFVKQSCNRFIKDLNRSVKAEEIWFDAESFERKCRIIEKLPHVKGEWAAKGELFVLSPWQIFIMANLFGFKVVRDGEKKDIRRYREAYVEVPRKNGKTFFIVGVGLLMLADDGEYGAEVYCGARSEKQAFEVFTPLKQICERDPDLREHYGINVNAKSVIIQGNGSKFEPVIGDPADGASPSCGIADEFHEHRTSNLVDTFVTGMGARKQPLMLYITTAGYDIGSPCYEKRDDIKRILDGSVVDDNIFGIIYSIDEDDEWDTEEALIKANPNYGISVNPEFLAGELAQARRSSVKQVAYKTKYLNIWVGAKAAWMNMLAFQACRRKDIQLSDFKGRECFVGLDLASTTDFASMAILFTPTETDSGFTVFYKNYLPEDTIMDVGNNLYKPWHSDGWITSTEGNVIDYAYIEEDVKRIAADHAVLDIAIDPHQATQFTTRMMAENIPITKYGQTVLNMSAPMKELERMILGKQVRFQSDPVIMWMMGNVVAKLDAKDNIYPRKERNINKIDGVVALIMAIGRMQSIEHPEDINDFLNDPISL